MASFTSFNKRYNKTFGEKVCNFDEFMGIKKDNKRVLRIILEKKEKEVVVKMNYVIYRNYRIDILPQEINNLISLYSVEYIKIVHKIECNNEYPFKPLLWKLDSVRYNIESQFTQMSIVEYFQYLTEVHNDSYKIYWNPAIHLDKDIMTNVVRINNYVLYYLENT
jgi:hypothetical protein